MATKMKHSKILSKLLVRFQNNLVHTHYKIVQSILIDLRLGPPGGVARFPIQYW